ncbi:hypothetical protein KUTeg_001276 [Tegillarca granosa]|uniref:Chromo domain-containing protein n=1 Tax=Tegillarca granosa TaxID=220873 RepID=A0ABQ9FWN7_TEGGR|nr:hypothetical protein KUTeg_001276 [Tegillarca granosa]
MKNYLKKEGIYYFVTTNEGKANMAERVILTLRRKFQKYFLKNRTYNYLDVLQQLVRSYNDTPHSSLRNLSPSMMDKSNESDIWSDMNLKPRLKDKRRRKTLFPYKFKIGDLVRISHLNRPFQRAYDEQFTTELFKKIKDFHNEILKWTFYSSELTKVEKDESSLYLIDKIIKSRMRKGKKQYFVHFEGWPESFNDWVDADEVKDISTK